MTFFPLLLILGVAAYQAYFFLIKKPQADNPHMRMFYDYREGEKLAEIWPNGLLWYREISNRERLIRQVGNTLGFVAGFSLHANYDPLVLSLTTDGTFILVDKRKKSNLGQPNIGTVRFRREQIQHIGRLNEQTFGAASGVGEMEEAYDLTITLTNGTTYRFTAPSSAYELMAGHRPLPTTPIS
jgi:hypothetical protein